MKFQFVHNNINVVNLEASLQFYTNALGLTEHHRKVQPDGSFILVYLEDETSGHLLELTWLRDWEAYEKHKEMGCICFENKAMGIYFIADPDGYWLEIIPGRRN